MNILGISCFYHDAAAAFVVDGTIVAAAQEERFTRKKHDARFPVRAIGYVLREAGVSPAEIDIIAFYDKPFLKFERIIETIIATAPMSLRSFLTAMPIWLKSKLWFENDVKEHLASFKGKIIYMEHHESHAASAFFPSPFETAAILTVDGVGEWATTSIGIGEGNSVRLLKEIHFPHSLGLLYSAFTYFLGFKVNSGEYKVMGLAPYGKPKYVDAIYAHLIDVKADGSFKLNMNYFDYGGGLRMTNERFSRLFGCSRREPESKLEQIHMDIAASLQQVTDETMLKLARYAKRVTGLDTLCLAGGVALNCVANGKIVESGEFRDVWIQPAAGDAGGALGAALGAWHLYLGRPRVSHRSDAQQGSLLGPAYTLEELQKWLEKEHIPYQHFSRADIAKKIATLLAEGKVIGYFSGRMEFGPRALGSRSIIADARNPHMQSTLNLKIKFRESFRPFAPSILAEKAREWFDLVTESPYMLLTAQVAKSRLLQTTQKEGQWGIDWLNVPKSTIPAVTHVDGSARVQTVSPKRNRYFYAVLKAFYERTGTPVLVNTSFNVRGEPIVESPEDAYRCFMRTDMDYLALGEFLIDKKRQPRPPADESWKREYELD